MDFNIVDMLIIAVIGLAVVAGMYKGFLSSLLATLGFVGAWFGAQQMYPRLANVVLSNNSLMDVLKYYLDAGNMFKTPALGATAVSSVVDDASVLNAAINELSTLPAVFRDAFKSNVTFQLFGTRMENGLQTPWLTTFTDYLNQTIWAAAINVLSFVVLFAVLYLLASLVVNLFNSIFHFPQMRHLDWMLGGLFGAARGYVILMLILAVVPMVLTVVNMKEITDLVAASKLMMWFPTDFTIPDIVRLTFQ